MALTEGPIVEQERAADSPLVVKVRRARYTTNARFWIDAEHFEVPSYDNVEHFVAALSRKGLLECDPVVGRALHGARQRLDERSIQRRFAEVTGLGLKAFQQIARAHEAVRLLRAEWSPAQVAAELGFTDQAHLTHSLKRFLGMTPRQIAKQGSGSSTAQPSCGPCPLRPRDPR